MNMHTSYLRRSACTAAALLTVAYGGTALAAQATIKHAPAARFVAEADGPAEHLRAGTLASFNPPLLDAGKFSFTAPGRTAATARLQTTERAFRFTPSGQGDGRKPLSLGVTSRVVASAPDVSRSTADSAATSPTAYNIDLAVGWRGFAMSGGYSRADGAYTGQVPTSLVPPRREAVDLGLSYRSKNWKTSLQATAETVAPLLMSAPEHRYSVEVGGAYALSSSLSVSGGVRYKLSPAAAGITEPLQPDRSVYLGTAFSF